MAKYSKVVEKSVGTSQEQIEATEEHQAKWLDTFIVVAAIVCFINLSIDLFRQFADIDFTRDKYLALQDVAGLWPTKAVKFI